MSLFARPMQPSERRSAIVLLAAGGFALLAAMEPFEGAAIPPTGPALHLPGPPVQPLAGAYAAGSPFDPARRAVDGIGRLPGEPEAAPPAAPPLVLVLSGILVEGDRRKAMFSGAGSGAWQEAGSAVGDWTLEAVEPRAVHLRRGDEVMVMRSDEALR